MIKKKIYNSIAKEINPLIKHKTILDIGSGGNIFYEYKLANKVIALDISEEMLKNLHDSDIEKIYSDARNMDKITNKSIDVILIVFALHHINGSNYESSIQSLRKIIDESFKKLKDNGELVILELTLNRLFFAIQRMLYKFTYLILKFFKTDMVFFYNDKIIIENISNSPSVADVVIKKIKMTGWLDPLLGTFPGIIKIPTYLMPTSIKLFYTKKN